MKTNDHLPLPPYAPLPDRYDPSFYRRCGQSGVLLPSLTLGLWHNFGDADNLHEARRMLCRAFDLGITHFDLANNYGPPYGSAERNFGKIMDLDFRPYRDEMFLATKAGFDMWPGPYGKGGSKKYLIASLDQSLKRMGVDYVDVFYHHVPDNDTPLEETADALAQVIRQGKALYAGISNYTKPDRLQAMVAALEERGVPLFIHQLRYSLLDRRGEAVLDTADEHGFGVITFSPLEQGILTGKYRKGVPEDSRAGDEKSYLRKGPDPDKVARASALEDLAEEIGCSLIQLAFAWNLRRPAVCSVLAGASRVEQIEENVKACQGLTLSEGDWSRVEKLLV
jgi:L-glyceraldehyde 3-phosphate reductase